MDANRDQMEQQQALMKQLLSRNGSSRLGCGLLGDPLEERVAALEREVADLRGRSIRARVRARVHGLLNKLLLWLPVPAAPLPAAPVSPWPQPVPPPQVRLPVEPFSDFPGAVDGFTKIPGPEPFDPGTHWHG